MRRAPGPAPPGIMGAMLTRRLTEDDWERLAAIRLEALRTDPDAFGSSLAREEGFRETHWRMRLRSGAWFTVHDGAEDVGLVCVIPEPGGEEGERHVVAMWVRPAARRQGAGRALLDAVAAWARQDGASAVTLWLVRGNDAAAAAYRSAGFEPTGVTMPLPRDPSRTEERWARVLAG